MTNGTSIWTLNHLSVSQLQNGPTYLGRFLFSTSPGPDRGELFVLFDPFFFTGPSLPTAVGSYSHLATGFDGFVGGSFVGRYGGGADGGSTILTVTETVAPEPSTLIPLALIGLFLGRKRIVQALR